MPTAMSPTFQVLGIPCVSSTAWGSAGCGGVEPAPRQSQHRVPGQRSCPAPWVAFAHLAVEIIFMALAHSLHPSQTFILPFRAFCPCSAVQVCCTINYCIQLENTILWLEFANQKALLSY